MSEQPFRTTARPIPPKPSERRALPLWPVALVSIATGWLLATTVAEWRVPQEQTVPAKEQIVPAIPAPVTQIVEVRSVLEMPTPTVTPLPTSEPTAKPTVDPALRFCDPDRPQPGRECQWPPNPTASPTPKPRCPPPQPGMWCVWASDPATGLEVETE